MKKGSIKNKRINEEVLRALSVILRDEVKDPRIDPLIAVTRVEVSPDLMYAKVHVSTPGDDESLSQSIEGLKSSQGFIRKELAGAINLRRTPELKFIPDQSMRYAFEMSKKIDEVISADLNHEKDTD